MAMVCQPYQQDNSADIRLAKRKSDTEKAAPAKKVKTDEPESEVSSNVFVGQLSWNVDNDWLQSEFAECGEIVSAKVIFDRESGRSKGFGYVQFADLDAAAKAIELEGKEVDGRPIRVNYAMQKPQGAPAAERRANTRGDQLSAPSDTLFVAGLSYSLTEDQVYEAFADCGDVQSVRLPTDRDTGAPKGIAYVQFSSQEGATAGLALQGSELGGRNIRLDYASARTEGGGGGRGGFGGGRGGGRGGFDRGGGRGGFSDRGGRGGRGGGRGGFNDRGRGGGRGRGAPRG